MGIVNATPDSFSGDGLVAGGPESVGRSTASLAEAIVRQALEMAEIGADLVDIGGESTRPGHQPVDEAEERRRVIDGVAAVHAARPGLPISVDTRRATIAAAALSSGAAMLNDVAAVTDRPTHSSASLQASRASS